MKNQLEHFLFEHQEFDILSLRLKTLAEYVTEGAILADVGTDHGYVPIVLAKAGIIKHGYAIDVNKGPLKKASAHIKAYHVEELVTTVLSDGLNELYQPVNHILIAGMGGMLINKILQCSVEKLNKVQRLILSPQHDVGAVRRMIHQIGFSIVFEDMIYDEKFYPMIVCEPGEESYDTDFAYQYGDYLLKHKPVVFLEYVQMKLNSIEKILKQLDNHNTCMHLERKAALKKEYDLLREVIT